MESEDHCKNCGGTTAQAMTFSRFCGVEADCCELSRLTTEKFDTWERAAEQKPVVECAA